MRRGLLFSLVLALVVSTLAAGRSREPLCFATTGGTVATCDTVGEAIGIGFEAFEPTMGSDHEGNLYFATTPGSGVALGWEASIGASFDRGANWTDIRPNTLGINTPPETNDPYAYVDPGTGRVFAFHMGPILTCSIMSWTDDKGATWDTNPAGCAPTGAWDHQTMVAARPVDGVDTFGYPNVLVQCVNAIYAAECGRSLDGGRTWLHTVPVHFNTNAAQGCGAQHGHLAADEAGTIYLPTSECGTNSTVFVSEDSGLTWERHVIAPGEIPFEDPAVAVDAEGTIYAVWADFSGGMLFSTSFDRAETWSTPIRVTPPTVTGKLPTIVSGDKGRIAFAFIGTDDYPVGGYQSEPWDEETETGWMAEDLEFGGWLTFSTDADSDTPTFTNVEATGLDPLLRGDVCNFNNRCSAEVDFIGSTVTPDGRVFGAVVDACFAECTPDQPKNDKAGTGVGAIVTIPGLDLCEATCPRFPAGSGEAIDAGLVPTVPSSFGRWKQRPELFSPSLEDLPAWADERRAYHLARNAHLAGRTR